MREGERGRVVSERVVVFWGGGRGGEHPRYVQMPLMIYCERHLTGIVSGSSFRECHCQNAVSADFDAPIIPLSPILQRKPTLDVEMGRQLPVISVNGRSL